MKQTYGYEQKKKADREKRSRWLNGVFWRCVISVALFLVVFLGGTVGRDSSGTVFDVVREWITREDSIVESVETLGRSILDGESWSDVMGDWYVDAFLPYHDPVTQNAD